jgi:hypothetical protein
MVYNEDMGKARTLLLPILLMGFLAGGSAFSQERGSVVVFPFSGGGLSEPELKSLTLVVEESLSRFDSLQVIDWSRREKVLAYLDPALMTCAELDCAVRAGTLLSADLIVLGSISRADGRLTLSVRVQDLRTGKSRQAQSAGIELPAGLAPAARLLAATLFGGGSPGASAAETGLDSAQRLKALESLAANLRATIAEIDRKRATAHAWGWVLMGVGVASAGLSGACWYMADQAYQDYVSTSDTALAQTYRSQVLLWDTLMLTSAGAGVLSIGGSIPFFALSPKSRAEKAELKRIETEMSALENPEGAKK